MKTCPAIRSVVVWAGAVLLLGCAGVRHFHYHPDTEIPGGPGLFTKQTGVFTLYSSRSDTNGSITVDGGTIEKTPDSSTQQQEFEAFQEWKSKRGSPEYKEFQEWQRFQEFKKWSESQSRQQQLPGGR